MARPLRIEYPGALYHITSRGNARSPIFEDHRDRREFLMILEDVVGRYNWLCHAFCLMDNHYHLLVETVDGNLSLGMRHLNGVYTQAFNRRHDRVGHVFQGRFKAILVEQESYLLELRRYVVLNPVRAGIVKDPGAYKWSSYQSTGGLVKPAPFLRVNWILDQFGKTPREAQKEYRRFVRAGIKEPSPWDELKAQCILGSKEFIEKLRPALKDKSKITEIPKEQRLASRRSLEELLPPEKVAKKEQRNEAIHKAYIEYGYTLSEIARHLGLHYATISRIIKTAMLEGKT
jgi:REP element-mobilizing transposase RayT